jgi:hypothetical protein
METEEQILPNEILARAIRSGKEFGWRQQDFINTVLAAQSAGLGIIGGQVQFVLPDGTCELYWLSYDTDERQSGETWKEYCSRTARECIAKFQKLVNTIDFVKEGIQHFDFLKAKATEGVDLLQYLSFILYFNNHETWLEREADAANN